MQKVYYDKKKRIDQNINIKRLYAAQHIGKKQVVDINKLLNRVKINKKNEIKKKIIIYLLTIFGIFLSTIMITTLK